METHVAKIISNSPRKQKNGTKLYTIDLLSDNLNFKISLIFLIIGTSQYEF